MKKIVILSGIQVINNPRVVKEADALSEAGYDVEVLAVIHDEASRRLTERLMAKRTWRHTAIADFSSPAPLLRADGFMLRAKSKLARVLKACLGMETPGQLGVVTGRLYRTARTRNADLYIAHLEQALWVGSRLIEDGHRVATDVEDWYSEDGLPADRATRPISLMKACERTLLTRSVYVTTTSRALAQGLGAAYGGQAPAVVYNSFPLEERAMMDGAVLDRRNSAIPSITWFSQRVGPGRGLEPLIAALAGIEVPFELHIRGTPRPGYLEQLLDKTSEQFRARVTLHSQVPQDELLSRLSEHDIGYCGETSDRLNQDLTIANKVFEYMRAGLAIVASNTSGQVEVSSQAPGSVHLFQQGDAEALRETFRSLISNPVRLAEAKNASLAALKEHFDWSQSKLRIQALANGELSSADHLAA